MSTEQTTCKRRREEIAKLIQEVGIWSINMADLGRQYGVSRSQILKDKKEILKTLPPEDAKEISVAVMFGLKTAFRGAQRMLLKEITKENTDKVLRASLVLTRISEVLSNKIEKFTIRDEANSGFQLIIQSNKSDKVEDKLEDKEIKEQEEETGQEEIVEEESIVIPQEEKEISPTSYISASFERPAGTIRKDENGRTLLKLRSD